ncbi:MAG: cell division protein FtsQ/DivIB [bacterium]|nr:cell division protein FtsQ/DivIB [bacterium]
MNPESGGNTGTARLFALAGLAAVLLLSGSVLLIWPPTFFEPGPVTQFEVRSEDADGDQAPGGYLSADEAIEFSGLERGVVYDDGELEAAEKRLALHPAVRSARVEQTGRNLIRIRLTERRCAAVVRNEERDGEGKSRTTLYEVDADLVILAENRIRCTGAPLVRGAFLRDEENLERFTDPVLTRMIAGLGVLRASYPELAARISELHWQRTGHLTLYLTPARVRVELPGLLDEATMQRLYAAVAYFETDGQRSGVIDLRGQGVVILPD